MSLTPTLMGGLGNILFQLASSYGIAKTYGIILCIDISKYRKTPHSNIEYFNGLLSKWVVHNKSVSFNNTLTETKLHPLQGVLTGRTIVYGYLQNYTYFWQYRQEIIDKFVFNRSIAERYPRLEESAFIHVRGGDYKGHPLHHVDLSQYYPRALKIVNAPHYYIFTNDVDYVNAQPWLPANYTLVKENEVDSLYLMSRCMKGAICPNSTFSWWGAFLNVNRPVCMPDKWFNDPSMYIDGFFFPGTNRVCTA